VKETLETQNSNLTGELKKVKQTSQAQQDTDFQANAVHIRAILSQFLAETPITSPANEARLVPLLSLLLFSKDEMKALEEKRNKYNEDMIKQHGKKGVFGMFGKKK